MTDCIDTNSVQKSSTVIDVASIVQQRRRSRVHGHPVQLYKVNTAATDVRKRKAKNSHMIYENKT